MQSLRVVKFEAIYSRFSQTRKIGNVALLPKFVYLYICSFRLDLQYFMLVNVKLDV